MSTERTRFFVESLGCAKNQVDSEEIVERLARAGYVRAESPEGAGLIIVNSCGFIEDAKRESIDAVLAMRERFPSAKIMLAGCLAQRYAGELERDLPEADIIFGNADLSLAAEAARLAMRRDEPTPAPTGIRPVRTLVPGPSASYPETIERSSLLNFPGCAYVKLSEGCSNRCSYCAIPLIRGPHRSRPLKDALAEIASLVGRGVKEIVLIGQDLGSWGRDFGAKEGDASDLPALLRAISRLPGDFRVRTLYVHPDHFPIGMLDAMRDDPRLLPYFDLPFQHASSRVLAAMNRSGSSGRYLELLATIRDALPDAIVRSTFLVGFPGEADEDFEELLAFQKAARLDWLGAFRYSREDGTPAFGMKGRVPAKVAATRIKAVQDAQAAITAASLERCVGRTLRCLIEERVEGEELSIGRVYSQAPDVDGATVVSASLEPGSLVDVRVLRANGVDLDAVPVSGGSAR
jgi:ribosomal protein S12 methylthiotransferase